MRDAIANAQSEVLLESYILADDATGRGFLQAATDAARRGCRVHVIVDGFGSYLLPSSRLAEVAAAGGHTLVYRPIEPWRSRWGLWRRDHRKMLVVDGRVAFIGGLNLANNYDEGLGRGRWRDLDVRIEGPAAAVLRHSFELTWNNECEGGQRMTAPPRGSFAALGPVAGGVPVQVVGNVGLGRRYYIRQAFLHAVKHAQSSVWIANPYFVPDRRVSRTLRRTARRGVDVRIVIPARSDVWLSDLASRAALPKLLRDGVRIAEFAPGMIHSKAAVVDARWATVGSYNLNHRSWRLDLEVSANIFDEAFASRLEEQLRADFEGSRELTVDSLARRPWPLRLLQALAYRFRVLV